MNSKKKEIVRSVISWILTVFLSVLLVVGALLAAFGLEFGRTAPLLQAAEKVEYAEKLRKTVASDYAAISDTTGIPRELSDHFLKDYLTDEQALYPLIHFREGGEPDLTAYREAVLSDIRALAKDMEERGELRFSSDEERKELDDSLVSLSDSYTSDLARAIRVHGVYSKVEYVADLYGALIKYLIAGMALILIFAVALLFPINRKNPFPYFYAAFGSAGLLCTVVSAVMLGTGYLQDLALDPVYVRDWLTEMVRRFLTVTLTAGVVYLAFALLFGVLAWVRSKKRKASSLREDRT